MTKEEAMKMALETLEGIQRYGLDTLSGRIDGPDDREWQRAGVNEMTKQARLAITAIKEHKDAYAQPEQEPVAVKHMMRWVDNLKWQSENGQHMNIPSGLSSGTCWELAIELENFIKHTNFPQIAINPEIVGYVAPQRTWVGLTAKEKHEFRYSHMTTADFIEDIEAKLKDKNTRGQE